MVTPRVAVVGAGIMGTCAAWHLARAGAAVTLLERQAEVAAGVTRRSYGWVGTGSALPSENAACFALEVQAVRDFARLERELGPLPIAARGALVWCDSDDETSALIAEQRAAGVRIEALDRRRVAERVPGLAGPPSVAAWAPDDFAIEPGDLARQFATAAQACGATVNCGVDVTAIEARRGRVAGVRTDSGFVAADTVVLANAAAAISLAAGAGLALPIGEEPAVLMRFADGTGSANGAVAHHLLYGKGLELRPGRAGGLVSAADYPAEGEAGLAALAERTRTAIAELLVPRPELSLLSVDAAWRPMTADGLPLARFLPEISGLYALVAHPGVMLAPYLGRLAAKDIVDG